MPVIEQTSLAADDPPGCPLIGWHSLVTAANVDTTTEDADFPATNLANPATHLKWVGGYNTADEYITVTGLTGTVSYIAVARHNWGSQAIPVSVEAAVLESSVKALLHFDTDFTDSSDVGNTFSANNVPTISSAQSKFGGASLSLGGTSYVQATSGLSNYYLGSNNFTIDTWIRPTTTGALEYIAGRAHNTGEASTNSAWTLAKNASNQLVFKMTVGTTVTTLTGTTAISANNWHHVAAIRNGNTVKVYLNGAEEASASFSDYINDGDQRLGIGSGGDFGTLFTGFIDEFRIVVGQAYWTAAFTPPTAAYPEFSTVISQQTVADDSPIIFRLDPSETERVRIKLAVTDTSAAPEAAVIYVGELLVLERSLGIGSGHVPVTYGRRTNVVNGMSDSGNFLGRIVLGEYRTSTAAFQWFTPEFYRSDVDEFIAAAQELPFFFAWSPEDYPAETGYCWLTNDAEPEVDPVTQRISLTLEMRGVA